jgi:hypothetical protein
MLRAIFVAMSVITIIGIAVISVPAPIHAWDLADVNPDPYYLGNSNSSNGPNTHCYTYDNRQFCGYQGQTSSFIGYSGQGSSSTWVCDISDNAKSCWQDAWHTQNSEASLMGAMHYRYCQEISIPQCKFQ